MITTARHGRVLVATLAKGEHNAIDDGLVEALSSALEEGERSNAVVLHLRSEAASFCGGADPARIAAWIAEGGADVLAADAARWSGLFDRFTTSPVTVFAEIGGPVLGAGVGLALACDLRMASAKALFGVPEARVGLLPAGGTMTRLAATSGVALAQRMLLAAQNLDAAEALKHGLVHWVVGPEELATKAEALVQRIAGLSPLALAEAKAVLAAAPGARLAQESEALRHLAGSAPDRARVAAFLDQLNQRAGGKHA